MTFQKGVFTYETGLIFHRLIVAGKIIDFDIFNSIIRKFNYQFEFSKPPAITKDQLKNNFIKMLAAEMLTFCKCAPLMFGHFVSEDNKYWRLLIELRRILSLLLSKHFDTEFLDYLENLISENHELYIKMFGPL